MCDNPTDKLIKLGKTLNKYLSSIDFFLSERGYTRCDIHVLLLIKEFPNLNEYNLADKSPVDVIETRRMVRKIGRSGLIEANGTDGYIVTSKGHDLINEVDEIQSNIICYITQKVPIEKRQDLFNAVANLMSIIPSK